MLISQLNTNHYAKENFADTNGIQSVTVERGYYVAQGGESEVLVNSFQGSNRIAWDSNTQENINVYREGVRQVKVNAFFSDTTNAVDLSENGKIKFDPVLNLGERIEIEQANVIQSLVRPEYPDFFEENIVVPFSPTPSQTLFTFSKSIPLSKNLIKAYSLKIDGVHQKQNPGNGTIGGSYREIPGTDGTFTQIEFNSAVGDTVSDVDVTIQSFGFYDANNINLQQFLQLQSDFNNKKNAYYFDANTYSAYGSTDNKIIRLSTVVNDTGSLLNIWDHSSTAANGDTWTFQVSGSLFVSAWVNTVTGSNCNIGISLNSSQLTTSIQNINVSDRKSISSTAAEPSIAPTGFVSSFIQINSSDIIRIHTDGSIPNTSSNCGINFIFIND